LGCDHHENLEGRRLAAALAQLIANQEPQQNPGANKSVQLFYAIYCA
jgi:hypothetical protein